MMIPTQIFGEKVWIYIKQQKKYSEGFSFGSSEFCPLLLASNVTIIG